MDLSPRAALDHMRSEEGRKKLRYAGVSLFFVPVGQILILIVKSILSRTTDIENPYTAASIISAAILTVPNFFANRRFVWRVQDRDNMRTQVVVFWTAAMLGVTLATLLTFVVEGLTEDQAPFVQAVAVIVAQLTGFGIVWVGRFLILDKWLFRLTHHGQDPTPEEEVEMHSDVPI